MKSNAFLAVAVLSSLALAGCSSMPSAPLIVTPAAPSVCLATCPETPMPPDAGQPESSLNLWISDLIRLAETCAQAKADCAEQLRQGSHDPSRKEH